MRCVSCDEPIYRLDEPCPHCQFKGDPALVEELTQVNWMLGEIANWQTLTAAARHKITQTYTARQRELEVKLGLRLSPFSDEEARKAWPELFRREALLQQTSEWLQAGLVTPAAASALRLSLCGNSFNAAPSPSRFNRGRGMDGTPTPS
jgi:hypothetical protein